MIAVSLQDEPDETEMAGEAEDRMRALSPAVRVAVGYMTSNYAENVTLQDLTRLTKRSPFQIIRAFRRELGVTPHNWLIRFRVAVGMSLLTGTDCIATVACEAGFADQTHFARHFKRLHGATPRQFRQAAARQHCPAAVRPQHCKEMLRAT
jgi:transcriptional regulator GlxA family with amidase domain